GMMIAFTMSIDDFVISYFTAGSQVSTLAMEVYSMARRKVSPEINALSTLMFLTVLTLLVIVNLRQMKQDKTLRRSRAKLTSDLEPTPLLSEEADESDF
ncbi:MAG: ABC transporter permease, partial [Oscillospiraceae bacterium]